MADQSFSYEPPLSNIINTIASLFSYGGPKANTPTSYSPNQGSSPRANHGKDVGSFYNDLAYSAENGVPTFTPYTSPLPDDMANVIPEYGNLEFMAETGSGLFSPTKRHGSKAGKEMKDASDLAPSEANPAREEFLSDMSSKENSAKEEKDGKIGSILSQAIMSANPEELLKNTSENNTAAGNSFTSRPHMTQMEEWYDWLENTEEGKEAAAANPLLADRDNYGYSALRASKNSDLLAQWALSDPRFMDRLKASGVDVTDTDNLSNNIYDYMWGDNVIDVVNAMQGNNSYLYGNDSDAISDLSGYLNSKYDFGFDPDTMNRLGLDNDDITTFLLLNQIGGKGWGNLDVNMVDDLLHKAGYLDQDSHIKWGSNKDSAWTDTQDIRNNARKYTDIGDESYSSDIAGQFDANVIGSLLALEEAGNQGKLDANGNPYQRRLVLDKSSTSKNKASSQKYKGSSENDADIQSAMAALGIV